MLVGGKRLSQTEVSHHDKRNTIDQSPTLIEVRSIKRERSRKQFCIQRDYLNFVRRKKMFDYLN